MTAACHSAATANDADVWRSSCGVNPARPTPKSSDDAIRELEDLVSPVSAFVRDECNRGPRCEVEAKMLYAAWKEWCEANGYRPTASHTFGRDLRSVIPGLRPFQPHGKSRHYAGVTLSKGRNG